MKYSKKNIHYIHLASFQICRDVSIYMSANVIYHINGIRGTNHKVISVDAKWPLTFFNMSS